MNAQARLGAFVLVGLLVLGLLSVKIGRIHIFGDGGAIVEAVFNDVGGLEEQTPVRLAGVRVGSVDSITLEHNRALVRIRLEPDIALPASTHASLVRGGLMGERFIALTADPADRKLLASGKRIPSAPGGGISMLFSKAGQIADDIHELASGGKAAIRKISAMLDENRRDIRNTIHNFSGVSDSVKQKLPPALDNLRHFSRDAARLMDRRKKDLNRALKHLPRAVEASERFFAEGKKTFHGASDILMDNRENLYRMIFEFRKTAENLEVLSDDLRRNPWKLMKKQPEVPPSPRVKLEKMEEMMLTTGQMGLAPAHK